MTAGKATAGKVTAAQARRMRSAARFYAVQALELAAGAMNLALLSLYYKF